MNNTTSKFHPWMLLTLILFTMGIILRTSLIATHASIGFDENLYQMYVGALQQIGLTDFPNLVQNYIEYQKSLPRAVLPPTRFLYIFFGYLYAGITHTDALTALHYVSSTFSILTLFVSFGFAYRLSGPLLANATLALMVFAPTQIHMSQHALIDGFFAFWAIFSVWILWECFQNPENRKLPWLLGFLLACLVMTKENSFFVYIGILALLAVHKWFKFGTASRQLYLTILIGPAVGFFTLVLLSGGLINFFEVYILLVRKAYTLKYAILTGDGPWYRYIVDLIVSAPITTLLAIGAIFTLKKNDTKSLYLISFIVFTYLIMANIKYGMNLRYTNMWDLPLRFLAAGMLWHFSSFLPRHRIPFFAFAIALVCLYDWHMYVRFFIDASLYELVTEGLIRAVNILKTP